MNQPRTAPIDLQADEFRLLGHQLVDRISDFLASLSHFTSSSVALHKLFRRS